MSVSELLQINNFIYFFDNYPFLTLIIVFILALMIGSFLNVLIYRLPLVIFSQWRKDCHDFLEINQEQPIDDKQVNILQPSRSFCPSCKTQIKSYDNIPVLSFIFLKGKCRHCADKISWRYPIIELITAMVSVLVIEKWGMTELGFCTLFLSYILIVIAAIDYDHLIIPDNLSYIGLWLGLLINISIFDIPSITPISDAIIGSVVGYLLLWFLYWTFKILTGKEGFGHGDFKLTALFGAWLGVYNIFPILIIASVTGIICAIISNLMGKHSLDKPFPFGPYLVIAGWLVLMYGNSWPINILTIVH